VKRIGARLAPWGGLLVFSFPAAAGAHSIRVYSEFQRIDPFGEVVAADRPPHPGIKPREILSPAVARNAFASFRIAVTLQEGGSYTLHVGQNPENMFRATVYKERFVKSAAAWVPHGLEAVALPYTGTLPEPSGIIPAQTTATFWLDIWIPFDAPAGRMKLEPQVFAEGHWATYPMEVRVTAAVVPALPVSHTPAAPTRDPSDASARAALQGYLCGETAGRISPGAYTVSGLIRRNALQDASLAQLLETRLSKEEVRRLLLAVTGENWCASGADPKRVSRR